MYHCFAWTCAVLMPLRIGASITILEAFSPKETIATIKEKQVTVIFGVPPMYNYLSRIGEPEDLASVRIFVSGGAALPQKVAVQFQQKYGTPILEGYGLSEASPVVALNPDHKTKYCSIGRALPGLTVQVVNSRGETLPPGDVGELVVKGPSVMQGYYNLPLETSRALRNGWLHTGDVGMLDEEGYVFIVDRKKDMVISGGENIYCAEVERVLGEMPGVTECAAFGIPDERLGEMLVCVVRAKGATEDGVIRWVAERLAKYKAPGHVAFLDETLPRNHVGKVDKIALRARWNEIYRKD